MKKLTNQEILDDAQETMNVNEEYICLLQKILKLESELKASLEAIVASRYEVQSKELQAPPFRQKLHTFRADLCDEPEPMNSRQLSQMSESR